MLPRILPSTLLSARLGLHRRQQITLEYAARSELGSRRHSLCRAKSERTVMSAFSSGYSCQAKENSPEHHRKDLHYGPQPGGAVTTRLQAMYFCRAARHVGQLSGRYEW